MARRLRRLRTKRRAPTRRTRDMPTCATTRRPSEAEFLSAGCEAASGGADDGSRGDARGAQRGGETKQHAGEDGGAGSETEDAPIEPEANEHTVTLGGKEGD